MYPKQEVFELNMCSSKAHPPKKNTIIVKTPFINISTYVYPVLLLHHLKLTKFSFTIVPTSAYS